MLPQNIPILLAQFNIVAALAAARAWLHTASYSDILAAVQQCPRRQRARLVALLHDVLAGYPKVTFGVPVLLHYTDRQGRSLQLPLPEFAPAPGVTAAYWIPLSRLRSDEPFTAQGESIRIEPGGISCAVLALRTESFTPPDSLHDERRWAELFALDDDRCIQLNTSLIAPWPAALEAAQILLAAASGARNITPPVFVDDGLWSRAGVTGASWRRHLQAL